MEDVAFARRLRRVGRIVTVPAYVRASGRRFLDRPLASFVAMWTFPTLYRLGRPVGGTTPNTQMWADHRNYSALDGANPATGVTDDLSSTTSVRTLAINGTNDSEPFSLHPFMQEIALDVVLLAQTEVGEVAESGGGGSSSR
jgi:hypothetical protein